MRIKTMNQVNTHLQDGREFSADGDAVVEIDDDDAAMVGVARSLIMSGQAVHYGDAGAVDEEPVEITEAITETPVVEDEDLEAPDDED